MSEPARDESSATDTTASGAAPMQFDRAEYDEAPSPSSHRCVLCQRDIDGDYYTINGKRSCAGCHVRLDGELKESRTKKAFLRAAGYGLLAAVAGALVWSLVRKVTGYELGLIAVGVGYAVAYMVRRGSRGLGSRRYRILAVALTYFSITLANVPLIMKALSEQRETQPASTTTSAANGPATAASPAAAAPARAPRPVEKAGVGMLLVAIALIFALAAIAPFLAGAQGIMGLLIIGIALWEAWRLTKPLVLDVQGPFGGEAGGG